jgi:hypothetical protein
MQSQALVKETVHNNHILLTKAEEKAYWNHIDNATRSNQKETKSSTVAKRKIYAWYNI